MILFLEEVIGFDPDNKKRWESILIQLSHLWRMVLYPNIFFFLLYFDVYYFWTIFT